MVLRVMGYKHPALMLATSRDYIVHVGILKTYGATVSNRGIQVGVRSRLDQNFNSDSN